MLLELHIENFTIIERATLQFGQGMTVITGKTGAGKSNWYGCIKLGTGQLRRQQNGTTQ